MRRENRSWTDEEVQKLRDMAAKGASPERIGIAIKRTTRTVKLKARQFGIRFPRVQRLSIDQIPRHPGTR
jgi:hypothetical protein